MIIPSASASSPFEISLATPSDTNEIVRIGRTEWDRTFSHLISPQSMTAYLDAAYTPEAIMKAITKPNLRFFVAGPTGQKERLAGFAALTLDTSLPAQCLTQLPKPITLQRIFIDSHYHGGGLAKSMMDKAYEMARDEGYESVYLEVLPENIRAVRFYQKCGFVKVGKVEIVIGGQKFMDEIMARLL